MAFQNQRSLLVSSEGEDKKKRTRLVMSGTGKGPHTLTDSDSGLLLSVFAFTVSLVSRKERVM